MSSAKNTFTNLFVFSVTGSEKSPPAGETAPIRVTEPSDPDKVFT